MPPKSSSSRAEAASSKRAGQQRKPVKKKHCKGKLPNQSPPDGTGKPQAEASKKSARQGVIDLPGMCQETFDLAAYASQALETIGCKPNLMGKPVSLATACSGSGAPTLVLRAMVSTNELMASDLSPAAAHACLVNARSEHCQDDVHNQAGRCKCFCYVCAKACPVLTSVVDLDIFVAGFPCNSNSLMKAGRFDQDATTTSDARVFQSVAKLVGQYRPKIAILENVNGINCQRGGAGESSHAPVKDWVMQKLQEFAGEDYEWEQLSLTSIVLWGPYL